VGLHAFAGDIRNKCFRGVVKYIIDLITLKIKAKCKMNNSFFLVTAKVGFLCEVIPLCSSSGQDGSQEAGAFLTTTSKYGLFLLILKTTDKLRFSRLH